MIGKGWHVFWLTVLLAACTEPQQADDLPPLEWKSDRIQLGTDLVDQVCAGTLTLLERDLEAIEQDLDFEPTTEPVAFWVLAEIDEHCTASSAGCAHDGKVYLSGLGFSSAHRHELVHVRVGREQQFGKPLFEEGLASAIGGYRHGCLADDECANSSLDSYINASESSELGVSGYRAGADLLHGMLDGGLRLCWRS